MSIALTIFGIIFPVFAVAALGTAYGRLRNVPMGALNAMNMDVFLPALVFWALAEKSLDVGTFVDLSLGGAAVILGSGLLVWPFVPLLRVKAATFLPPMMFNNSGNMGLPLALFAFGESALQAAVVLFIIELVLHLTVGIYMLDSRTHPLRLLKMPVIVATLAGLAVSTSGATPPGWLLEPLRMLGQVSIPLMLFSLGARLNDINFSDWRVGLVGAVLCPLSGMAIALGAGLLLNLDPTQQGLLLIFGALPPAVTNYIIAEQYRQEPEKVASIVVLGTLGSLLFIPLALAYVLPVGPVP